MSNKQHGHPPKKSVIAATLFPRITSFSSLTQCLQLLILGFILAPLYSHATPDSSINLSLEEQEWLALHPVVSIAYDGYFPPYSFLDNDKSIDGFSPELFGIISKKLGVEFSPYAKTQWKELYEDAKQHKVDIVATMVERDERNTWFKFSDPYIRKSLVIITRDDNTEIDSKFDLKYKKVALVSDYQYAKRITKEFPTIQPLKVDTMLDALNAVSVGDADAAVSFIGAGHYYRTKYLISNLKYAAIYDSNGSPESIAVRKDWPLLTSILTKALRSIPEDQLQALRSKWLPIDYLQANRQVRLSPDERAWADAHPTIKLGVDPEFAPFEFFEDGQYKGLASDYISLLNRRLNLNLEVIPDLSWAEVTEKAKNKQLDVMPAVGMTEERKKFF